jgi:hypothetical protein
VPPLAFVRPRPLTIRAAHMAASGAATAALAAGAVHGAHPLITEDTGTQGAGGWQLEVNGERTRDRSDGVFTRGFQAAGTLSYGIVDRADLQLTLPYVRQKAEGERVSGKLDFAVDLKWRFYENGPLSLGLKPGLTFPGGRDEEGLGTGRSTWGSLAILSYDRERWAFHSHIGYRHNRNNADQRTSLRHISASLWIKPSERLKLVSDYSVDTNPDRSSDRLVRQTVLGFIYSVVPTFDLDLGVRFGNTPAIDRAVLFGTTLRW